MVTGRYTLLDEQKLPLMWSFVDLLDPPSGLLQAGHAGTAQHKYIFYDGTAKLMRANMSYEDDLAALSGEPPKPPADLKEPARQAWLLAAWRARVQWAQAAAAKGKQ